MNQNLIIIMTLGVVILVTILYKLVKSVVLVESVRNGDDLFISEGDVYEQVRLSIANGNHQVAQKLAKKYLKENPSHDKLRILLARSYYDIGALSEAIEQFEILKKAFPDRMDLLLMLADAYKKTGQNNNAIDLYQELLEYNPNSVDVMCALAELYVNVNHKKSALNLYRRLLNLDIDEREKINYYYETAFIYKDLGEYENAIEFINFGLNVDSQNIKLLYLYKDLCEIIKDTTKEIEIMNRLIILAPTDAYLQLDLVNLYYKSEMYEKALDIAIPAVNTPNADVQALQDIIANIYIKTDRVDEGINILEELLKVYPESIRIIETLAYAYRLNAKFSDSIELYEKLVELSDIKKAKVYNSELSSVYCDWALHLYNSGEVKDVFSKFERALKLNPDNPDIYEALSRVNFMSKNYSDAIRQMQKAIDLNPGNGDYYTFLGNIYCEIENIYEAERVYKEAIFINPQNAVCHAKLGVIKLKQKDIQSALEHLGVAINLDKENWDYLYNMALAYELAGDVEHAISTYNKVLSLNPNHVEAAKNLKMLNNSK